MLKGENSTKPIFVVGNPRSGTTMLRLALTCHPCISIPPESPFIIYLFPKYGHVKKLDEGTLASFLEDLKKTKIYPVLRWKMKKSTFDKATSNMLGKSYAEACQLIYEYYPKLGTEGTLKYWGDKNTAFYNHIDTLSFLYPEAKYIHLIRDARSIYASYKGLRQKVVENKSDYYPNLPACPIESSARWQDAVETTETLLKNKQSISIRYEDLVSNPVPELQRVCTFLDLPFDTGMLSFYKKNKKFELEPKEHDEWKSKTQHPISTDRISAWKNKLSIEEISKVEKTCGNTLKRFDYKIDTKNSFFQRLQVLPKKNYYKTLFSLKRLARRVRLFVVKTRT